LNVDFATLYRTHYPRVFGLCRRMLGGIGSAEDATQEVFLRAFRALDRYDSRQPFAAWVLGIAGNHCIDLVRRRAQGAKLFEEDAADAVALDASAPTALDALVDAERADEIRAAIAALPDRYRLPIVLAYYNESSYDEIAHALGVTRNHVGVLLLRARQQLRLELAGTQEDL
jgi:RNA polymerase sigma-70 factor (ECF subfamily)